MSNSRLCREGDLKIGQRGLGLAMECHDIRDQDTDTILVAEKNGNQRSLYEQELSDEGYQVITIGDEKELVNAIKNLVPSLVILDPLIAGEDRITMIRSFLDKNGHTPIIINTAYSSMLKPAKADACIIKTGNLYRLKVKVKELLRRYKGYK